MKKIVIVTVLCFLASCSPYLGTSLPASVVYPKEIKTISATRTVKILPFLDERRNPAIGKINGRSVPATADISIAVQRAVNQRLNDATVRSSLIAGELCLSGRVQEWLVTVTPDFPMTEFKAKAKLMIEIATCDTQTPIFRGTYQGESERKHLFGSELTAQECLGEGMGVAVSALLADPKFLGLVQ